MQPFKTIKIDIFSMGKIETIFIFIECAKIRKEKEKTNASRKYQCILVFLSFCYFAVIFFLHFPVAKNVKVEIHLKNQTLVRVQRLQYTIGSVLVYCHFLSSFVYSFLRRVIEFFYTYVRDFDFAFTIKFCLQSLSMNLSWSPNLEQLRVYVLLLSRA